MPYLFLRLPAVPAIPQSLLRCSAATHSLRGDVAAFGTRTAAVLTLLPSRAHSRVCAPFCAFLSAAPCCAVPPFRRPIPKPLHGILPAPSA